MYGMETCTIHMMHLASRNECSPGAHGELASHWHRIPASGSANDLTHLVDFTSRLAQPGDRNQTRGELIEFRHGCARNHLDDQCRAQWPSTPCLSHAASSRHLTASESQPQTRHRPGDPESDTSLSPATHVRRSAGAGARGPAPAVVPLSDASPTCTPSRKASSDLTSQCRASSTRRATDQIFRSIVFVLLYRDFPGMPLMAVILPSPPVPPIRGSSPSRACLRASADLAAGHVVVVFLR